MHLFDLDRIEDETGISGTGIVAQGVLFDDGTCALRWLTANRSSGFYDNVETLEKIHGHNGKTVIRWRGKGTFERARTDCIQDGCENCPFASIGGLDARAVPRAPDYIEPAEREEYLRGYVYEARRQYGADWQTCGFGWAPAMTINEPPVQAPREGSGEKT